MAHLDREPFFILKKSYADSSETTYETHKFVMDGNKRTTTHVTKDSGHYGIEFTLEKTVTEFKEAQKENNWSNDLKWTNFRRCLLGPRRTAWDNLVTAEYAIENTRTTAEFNTALDKWLIKILNCEYPRDVMYRYFENRKTCKNEFDKDCNEHHQRWDEAFGHALMLPKGNMADPTDARRLELYYQTFCRPHRLNYLAAGNNLANETAGNVTEFMRLQMENDQASGTLDRLRSNRNKSHRSNKKIRGDERRRSRSRSSERHGRSSGYRSSRRRSPDRNRRSSGYQRDGYSRGNDYGRHRNRDKSRRDDKPRSRDKKPERDKNSFPNPCKQHGPKSQHTWEDCNDNPKNAKKKSYREKHESHYQSDDDSRGSRRSRSRSRSYSGDSHSSRRSRSESSHASSNGKGESYAVMDEDTKKSPPEAAAAAKKVHFVSAKRKNEKDDNRWYTSESEEVSPDWTLPGSNTKKVAEYLRKKNCKEDKQQGHSI